LQEESLTIRKTSTLPGEEEDGVCSNPGRDLQNILEKRIKKNPRFNYSVLGINRTTMFQNLHENNKNLSEMRPATSMGTSMHPGLNICNVKTPKTAIRMMRERDYNQMNNKD
jgi:hypothetical protein